MLQKKITNKTRKVHKDSTHIKNPLPLCDKGKQMLFFGQIILKYHAVKSVFVCLGLLLGRAHSPRVGHGAHHSCKLQRHGAGMPVVVCHKGRSAKAVEQQALKKKIKGLSVFFIFVISVGKYASRYSRRYFRKGRK